MRTSAPPSTGPLVRARECKEQGFKHSKPRIWIGKEIAAKLPHTWNPSGLRIEQ